MIPHEDRSEIGKLNPRFNPSGRTRKKSSDGSTAQKILIDRSLTRLASPVSQYSQVKARIEVSGKDAMTAAKAFDRLAISDTEAMTREERRTLSRNLMT